jgi:hypothetical protein
MDKFREVYSKYNLCSKTAKLESSLLDCSKGEAAM